MKINLIDKVSLEFRDMSFNEKILFLKDYKQSVELLPAYIKHHIEFNNKGVKNSLIKELLSVIPTAYQLDPRSYYMKISKPNPYENCDLLLIVALAKVLKNKELLEKTYRLIVFMQKNMLWEDCTKMGIFKNHFKVYWDHHPDSSRFYKLARHNKHWPYLIDFITDVYDFLNYVMNYHHSYNQTFRKLPDSDGADYIVPGIKLDPNAYNIEFD
jgi:hypothetical protein